MLDSLEYFIGKPCTVSTLQINFRFKEEQMMDYFMGFIEYIDEHGMVLIHPVTKCKTYIFLKHVVAIAEEQMLDENKPEDAKVIEEYRKEKPVTASKTATGSKFMDAKNLADLARKAKEKFTK